MSQLDYNKCKELRKKVFITGYNGGMAHLASCFSAIEIIYTLYMKGILKHDPQKPLIKERDRFVLSKGHAGLALYSVLELAGYFDGDVVASYLKPGGIGGEPNYGDAFGIEASTGSLGHGLSIAVGMALAQKSNRSGAKTYVLIGDGESQEGSIWEAAMAASTFELDNLISILDCNELQKTNRIDETMKCVSWEEKWKAFGWNVMSCDGHNIDALQEAFTSIPKNGKPTMIIAKTTKGKGVSIMEAVPKWHFKLPNKKELKIIMEELHISEEELAV